MRASLTYLPRQITITHTPLATKPSAMTTLTDETENHSFLVKIARRMHPSITPSEREAMEANGNPDEDFQFITLPDEGSGHNSGLKRAADLLLNVFELPEEAAEDHLGSIYHRGDADIRRVIQRVRQGVQSDARTKFPARDNRLIAAAAKQSRKTIEDLQRLSPGALETPAFDVIAVLMREADGEDPLVCIGYAENKFSTKPLSAFKAIAHECPFIVPQPMTSIQGKTKAGHLSTKADANTSERKNLVVESDKIVSKDTQAALLLFLARFAPLICVCDSGGKSLHGYFDVAERTHDEKERFMRAACLLGADKALWTLSQFARIPGGTRPAVPADGDTPAKPAAHQALLYFDPDAPGKHWRLEELEEWIESRLDQLEAEAKASLRERAYALRFDPSEAPPPDETCMMIGDYPIAARGNLTVIQGKSKVGKSAVVSAILGAVHRGEVEAHGDTLCVSWTGESTGAIIHLDTEQSRADWHGLVSRGITRSGMPDVSDRLVSLPLVMFARSERLEILRETLEYEQERRGGIDAVIIDGIADLCKSPNDEAEALELVSQLMALAQEFHSPLFCILHENPGTQDAKTRGHLGSELNRKAFANVRIDKDTETSVSTIYGTDMRKRDIPKVQGFCFAWNDAARMHTFQGRAAGLKAAKKEEQAVTKAQKEWEMIFEAAGIGTNEECPAITPEQAAQASRDISGTEKAVTVGAMKKRMQRAEALGVLRKDEAGTWTLNPSGQSGQNRDI